MKKSQSNYGLVVDPWPSLIYKFEYDFKWEEIQGEVCSFIDNVENNSLLEVGQSTSTVVARLQGPHTWGLFAPFMEWLKDPIQEVWERLGYPANGNSITAQQSWFNKHRNGGETLEHAHGYTELVVTSYLRLPENSGYIQFRDPLEWHKINTPNEMIEPFYTVPCKQNEVLIFPGWLKHRTEKNETNDDRIVMTMNFM